MEMKKIMLVLVAIFFGSGSLMSQSNTEQFWIFNSKINTTENTINISGSMAEAINPYGYLVNTESFQAEVMIIDTSDKTNVIFLDFINQEFTYKYLEKSFSHEKLDPAWLYELRFYINWEYKNTGKILSVSIPAVANAKTISIKDDEYGFVPEKNGKRIETILKVAAGEPIEISYKLINE